MEYASGAGLPTGNSARTFEIWFKTKGGGANGEMLFGYGVIGVNEGHAWNDVYLYGASEVRLSQDKEYARIDTGRTLTDGNAHMLDVTYDPSAGDLVSVYVDGAFVGSSPEPSPLATQQGPFSIGSEWSGSTPPASYPFTGNLGDSVIYPTALTASQVAAHYAAGTSCVGPPYAPPRLATNQPNPNSANLGTSSSPHLYYVVHLSGSIVQCTRPVTEYWFEYGPANASAFTNSTAHVAGPGPSGTVSTDLTDGNSSLQLYRLYKYRLVASDGQTVVFGPQESFVLGNLFNPPGFDLTGAQFNLAFVCGGGGPDYSGPQIYSCPGLGYIVSPFSQYTDGSFTGTLKVDTFDTVKDTFSGHAQLLFHDSGGSSEGIVNTDFDVTGRVALGVVSMEAHQSVCSGGFCAYFSVAGTAQYGGMALSNGNRYAPILGGSFPSCLPYGCPDTPAVDTGSLWTACYEAQQDCVAAPPTDNKQAAAVLGEAAGIGSLAAVEFPPAAFGLGAFSAIMGLIALDPPDAHYKHVTRPRRAPHVVLHAGRGISSRTAVISTRLMNDMAQMGATGVAFVAALQRAQGATLAGDARALGLQHHFALQYGRQLVGQCRQTATLIKTQAKLLGRSRLGSRRKPGAAIGQALRNARRRGLIASPIARRLEQLGFSAVTLGALRRFLPSRVPADSGSPLAPLLTQAFSARFGSFCDLLSSYLVRLREHPIG